MSEKPRDRPKDWSFVQINQLDLAMRLLKAGSKINARSVIWTKDQSLEIATRLVGTMEYDEKLCLEVPSGVSPGEFSLSISRKDSPECYLAVKLDKATLFFKSKFSGYSTREGFLFSYPEKVFKVQRRKNVRWEIRAGYVLKIDYQDPLAPEQLMSRKVIDISENGLSFVVPEEEKPLYTVGSTVRSIRFKLKMKLIEAEGEVKHVASYDKYSNQSGLKIGVHFTKISNASKLVIGTYVMEEMLKLNQRAL